MAEPRNHRNPVVLDVLGFFEMLSMARPETLSTVAAHIGGVDRVPRLAPGDALLTEAITEALWGFAMGTGLLADGSQDHPAEALFRGADALADALREAPLADLEDAEAHFKRPPQDPDLNDLECAAAAAIFAAGALVCRGAINRVLTSGRAASSI